MQSDPFPSNSHHPDPGASAPRGLKIAGGLATIVAVGVVIAGTMARTQDVSEAQHWSDSRSIPVVHLVHVQPSAATDALSLPGTLAAWNAAKLYARVGGYVRSWDRDIGAVVTAGAPLAQIDTPELDQQIGQARADLTSARANASLAHSTAARWNDLLSTRSVSQQEADEKNGELAVRNAAVQAAKANLGRLMALKDFATIRTPFAGVITTRSADIGDLVGPSSSNPQPLFSIADLRRLRIYVSVPQAYSAAIHPGLTATMTVPDYPGRTFTAKVVGASGAVNQQSGTFDVQLIADNPSQLLKAGGYAQVRFDVPGQASSVQIPSSALIFRSQGTQVALVGTDDRIHLHRITIGRDLGQKVEVNAGLAPNDRVVDNPPDSVSEGQLVRTQQADHA